MQGFTLSFLYGILGFVTLGLIVTFTGDLAVRSSLGPALLLGTSIIFASLIWSAAYVFRQERKVYLGEYTMNAESMDKQPTAQKMGPSSVLDGNQIGGEIGQSPTGRPKHSRWPQT